MIPGIPGEEVAYDRASGLGPEYGIPDSQPGAFPIELAVAMVVLLSATVFHDGIPKS